MLKRTCRKKSGKKAKGQTEELQPPVVVRKKTNNPQSGFYKAGPLLAVPNMAEGNPESLQNIGQLLTGSAKNRPIPITLPNIKGQGTPAQDSARANSVSLEGLTEAHFNGGSFETQSVRVSAAEGCDSCSEPDPCVHVTGVLVSRFHVTTTVTLPSVADYPDLTPCQQRRVQDAITNVLAPHEQRHVRAFSQYNGVTRTPFDLTLCRSEFESTIQSTFDDLESTRRDAAQADSDALDPFNFVVDLDCEEPPEETAGQSGDVSENETETTEVPAEQESEKLS